MTLSGCLLLALWGAEPLLGGEPSSFPAFMVLVLCRFGFVEQLWQQDLAPESCVSSCCACRCCL